MPTPDDLAASVPKPASDRIDEARALWTRLLGTRDALGRLGQAAAHLCAMQDACPPRPLERLRVLAITDKDQRTPDTALALSAAADSASIPLRWLSAPDGMTTATALAQGAAAVDAEVDTGVDLLVLVDVGDPSTQAASAIGLLANRDAATVTPRPVELDDAAWMAQCTAVREGMRRAREHRGDPLALLETLGSATLSATAGALLQAAVRRTPMVIDGTGPAAAALIVHRLAHRSTRWWWAASASSDPGLTAALDRLDAEPLLSDRVPPAQGVAGVLATTALRSVVAVMSHSGRTVA